MGCESEHGELFSLDISHHGATAFSKISNSHLLAAEQQGSKLAEYAAAAAGFEADLLQTVRTLKPKCVSFKGIDYDNLATLLSESGYLTCTQAPALECKCKTRSRKCLERLTHTYLVCNGSAKPPRLTADLIVEPRLKEQFEIAHPTEAYQKLLEHLPAEFVGAPSKLRTVVEVVSLAMAEAFKAKEMSLPPWRRTSAALSKWNLDDGQHSALSRADRLSSQPLKDRHINIGSQPEDAVEDVFAKASITQAQRFLSGSGRQPLINISAGLENVLETNKPKVSLLARNLAKMAPMQKPKRALDVIPSTKNRIKRAPSWDFSGLPPITTVRRSGKVM